MSRAFRGVYVLPGHAGALGEACEQPKCGLEHLDLVLGCVEQHGCDSPWDRGIAQAGIPAA